MLIEKKHLPLVDILLRRLPYPLRTLHVDVPGQNREKGTSVKPIVVASCGDATFCCFHSGVVVLSFIFAAFAAVDVKVAVTSICFCICVLVAISADIEVAAI